MKLIKSFLLFYYLLYYLILICIYLFDQRIWLFPLRFFFSLFYFTCFVNHLVISFVYYLLESQSSALEHVFGYKDLNLLNPFAVKIPLNLLINLLVVITI